MNGSVIRFTACLFLSSAHFAAAETPGTQCVPLASLEPDSATQSWGGPQYDRSVGNNRLCVAGEVFGRGLGTHANSELVYPIDTRFHRLTARVGVDDELADHPDAAKASVVFQVFADGVKLFDSGVMRKGVPAKPVDVDLTGRQELKLVVRDAGDGITSDHADWCEPRLHPAENRKDQSAAEHELRCAGLALGFDPQGRIVRCALGNPHHAMPIRGSSRIAGFSSTAEALVTRTDDSCAFTRRLTGPSEQVVTLVDRFTAEPDSVRWDIEITGSGAFTTAPIISEIQCLDAGSRLFWTAWGSPETARNEKADDAGVWHDPLVPAGFPRKKWHYGNVAQSTPVGADYISLPLASILDPRTDSGMSIVWSPENVTLDLDLAVTPDGLLRFTRGSHRIGAGKTLRFTAHLVPHEADWRGGLRFLTNKHARFMDPPNPRVHRMAGCGAYSIGELFVDTAELRKMAFGFNWKLSDDFPYMGMFIPPVKDIDEAWERSCDERSADYKGRTTTCRRMNDYAAHMKRSGFAVLSYFNVTEFGKNMNGRKPVLQAGDSRLWQDPAAFLRHALPHAALEPPVITCYGARVTDCGDPAYQEFLLEQADRNTRLLPDTDGICIDRADWLRVHNRNADDGESWIDVKPARSLFRSWIGLMDRLGPRMHAADKLVFSNLMTMRLELAEHLDGIYTEFGHNGNALNASALLGLRKPVVCWTYNETLSQPGPDAFMQRHLHMGCFPTAPYPFNNHCITPAPEAVRVFLDYGPLLDAMRGRRWVLEPHCVNTSSPATKVNLFETADRLVVPVTFGGGEKSVRVTLRGVAVPDRFTAEVIHPGVSTPVKIPVEAAGGSFEIEVPLVRGCGLVCLPRAER